MSRMIAVVVLSTLLSTQSAFAANPAGTDTEGAVESESFGYSARSATPNKVIAEIEKESSAALSSDPHVRGILNTLWRLSKFGSTCEERGAWIVRQADGSYSCLQVPATHQCDALTFSPLRPINAVAFVHTHPNRSAGARENDLNDQLAAHRIGLPMYTLHRMGLWEYDPRTGVTEQQIGPMGWQKGMIEDQRCPVMGPSTKLADQMPAGIPVMVVKNAP